MTVKLTLNSNINSLRAQRQLSNTSDRLSRAYERMATGVRINRASDDAAGLAVAEKLKTDGVILDQAARNVNDGISVLSHTEDAVRSLSTVVTRLKELSSSAANGVFGLEQRLAMNEEADELVNEYNRIIEGTTYNERALLSAADTSLSIQAGAGNASSIVMQFADELKSAIGDGTTSITSSGMSVLNTDAELVDVNSDGVLDLVASASDNSRIVVKLGNGDGTFQGGQNTNHNMDGSGEFTVADFTGDGIMDIFVVRGSNSAKISLNVDEESVLLTGNNDGTFSVGAHLNLIGGKNFVNDGVTSGDLDNDGDFDVVVAYSGTIYTKQNDGTGGFSALANYDSGVSGGQEDVELADLNGDGYLDLVSTSGSTDDFVRVRLNDGDGTFGAATDYSTGDNPTGLDIADVNRDGHLDLVTVTKGDGTLEVFINNGDGTFDSGTSYGGATGSEVYSHLELADMNGDGLLDAVASDTGSTDISIFAGNLDGTFDDPTTVAAGDKTLVVTTGDVDQDGINDFATITTNDDNVDLHIQGSTETATLAYLNLLDTESAAAALDTLSSKLEDLELQIGILGGQENRLDSARSVIINTREHTVAAYNKIMDIDVAQEMAEMLKLQVLEQAGTSVLAQANQEPETVFQLLSTKV